MAKRLLVLVVLLLVLPATALAATVHVRVEGKTKTLFAPPEVTVTAANALDALQQASLAGEFYYHVTTIELRQLRRPGRALRWRRRDSGWVFKVNDVSPPVGADQVVLKDGDHVLWYYATFGPTGGPPTLEVKAAAERLLHGDGVRRQREGRRRHRARLARRLAEVRRGLDGEVALPRAASGCARARDGNRRRSVERGEVRLAAVLALALALAGCGGGGREHGTATLWVTRDRGGQVVFAGSVPAGLDGIQAVERKLKVTTRYGGRYRAVDRRDLRFADRTARLVLLRRRRSRATGAPPR